MGDPYQPHVKSPHNARESHKQSRKLIQRRGVTRVGVVTVRCAISLIRPTVSLNRPPVNLVRPELSLIRPAVSLLVGLVRPGGQ